MIILFLIVAIIGTLVIVKLNSPEYKGKTGEKLVAERLEIIDGYKHILNDIMLNDNGKSRQIDHIAITEYGVYIKHRRKARSRGIKLLLKSDKRYCTKCKFCAIRYRSKIYGLPLQVSF